MKSSKQLLNYKQRKVFMLPRESEKGSVMCCGAWEDKRDALLHFALPGKLKKERDGG